MYQPLPASTRWPTIADAYFATLPFSLFFGILAIIIGLVVIHKRFGLKSNPPLIAIWIILPLSLSFFFNIFVASAMNNV